VLENNDFGVYIEQEPYVRELLDAYMASKFKAVLALLDKYSVRAPPPSCGSRANGRVNRPGTRSTYTSRRTSRRSRRSCATGAW
jgi:hypothetical protein